MFSAAVQPKVQRNCVCAPSAPRPWVAAPSIRAPAAPLRNTVRQVAQDDAAAAAAVDASATPSDKIPVADLVNGQVYEGTVKSVAAYGAFVDIGSTTDGLVHISQLAHGYVKDINEFISVGQKVSVALLSVEGDSKLSLSIKAATPETEEEKASRESKQQGGGQRAPRRNRTPAAPQHSLEVGEEVTGTVARIAPFGAFVKLEDGFEVLLPTSEMSGASEELDPNPNNLVSENSTVTGTVIKIDRNKVAMTNMSKEERSGASAIKAEKSEASVVLGGSLLADISGLDNAKLQAMIAAAPSKQASEPAPAEPEAAPAAAEAAAPAEEPSAEAEPEATAPAEPEVAAPADAEEPAAEAEAAPEPEAAAEPAAEQAAPAPAEPAAVSTSAHGAVVAYVHAGAQIGVLAELQCESDSVASGEEFLDFAANVAMQVVASADVKVVSPDDVPEEVIAKEREIELGKEDLQSKPENIREKIVEGRLSKLKKEQALISQAYIRSETSETLEKVLKAKSSELGESISIRRFVRYNLGEGLEKKSEDFAAEVAAQTEAKDAAPAAPEPPKEEKPKEEEVVPDIKVDAKLVKELRGSSGAGMMDCKKALKMCNNNLEEAAVWLKQKGLASASKKASRIAAEGLVQSYVDAGSNLGILLEVNCETDFVAKGDTFKNLADSLARQIAASPGVQYVSPDDVPQGAGGDVGELCLLNQPFIDTPDKTVETVVKEAIASTGENIKVRRFTRFTLGGDL